MISRVSENQTTNNRSDSPDIQFSDIIEIIFIAGMLGTCKKKVFRGDSGGEMKKFKTARH